MKYPIGTLVAYDHSNGLNSFEVYGTVVAVDDETTEVRHKHGFDVVVPNHELREIHARKDVMKAVKTSVNFMIRTNDKLPSNERRTSHFLHSHIFHEIKNVYSLNALEIDLLDDILDDHLI